MRVFDLLPSARRDLAAIRRVSRRSFGVEAADRYNALLVRAMFDIRIDPSRRGSRAVPGTKTIRTYHIRHARERLPAEDRVGYPRHLLVYWFDDDLVELNRVFHDSMDLSRRLRNVVLRPR